MLRVLRDAAWLAGLLAMLAVGGCVRMDDDFADEHEPGASPPPATSSTTASPPAPGSDSPAAISMAAGRESSPSAAPPDPEVVELLEQARWAMDAGRLNHPPGFNARDYFQQVLLKDPANETAREGLRQVLDASIEQSLAAAQRGDFKQAELYLTRAGKFALADPGIRGARRYIHARSREVRREFELPAAAVRRRDVTAINATLDLIAERAVDNEALVEIFVEDDLQGIWLFEQLRRHAGREPLHATIQAAAEPHVRLVWRR